MKKGERLLVVLGCIALLAVSWLVTVTAKSDDQKQAELLSQAESYLADEVYIKAAPLLEEAAAYSGARTSEAEEKLKSTYLALGSAYFGNYEDCLERQMSRETCPPAIFQEAAEYYMARSELSEALKILRNGVERTGDEALNKLYEEKRYAYTLTDSDYEEVTVISEGGLQVRRDGKWGIANGKGSQVIPCIYDKISTYSNGQFIVEQDGVISAIDTHNYRTALLHTEAADFGNYAQGRTSLLLEDGWHQADGNFQIFGESYEEIGIYAEGYAAAKTNGHWGVINGKGEWVIPPEYDDVIQDGVGRCCAQGMVFVRRGDQVLQMSVADGLQIGEPYQDAKPFSDAWAAVKREGLWGFVDHTGQVRIDFRFEEADSFCQHLAAVREGELWGYLSLAGQMVIEPQFREARGFYDGTAAVRVGDTWCFISLEEYNSGSEVSF